VTHRARIASAVLAAGACFLGAGSASALSGTATIVTIAGSGGAGYSGDGGKATAAKLNAPGGVAVDAAGNVYIADTGNHRIRKVTTAGVISTIAGTGAGGFSGDGGPATAAQLLSPQGIALDGQGNLYIADTGNNRVRRIAADGTISTVAGTGIADQAPDGTPATQATLNAPTGVAIDGSGGVYVQEADRILKILGDATIRTVAGAVYASGFNGDGIPAASALLDSPSGIALDAAGNVYISDYDNERVRKVGADGIITTIAGTGAEGFSGNGSATSSQLSGPAGLAADAAGNVYVADGHRVRQISPAGKITTIAGTGADGFAGDLGPATRAKLNGPLAVAVDAAGRVYVADTRNNRVRKIAELGPDLGTVAKAWVSATRAGPPVTRLSTAAQEVWVHFVFAKQPAGDLPIEVELDGPKGKLGSVRKPGGPRIDASIRLAPNAHFLPGRWRAVLRVAGRPVKTIAFKIAAFELE